MLQSRHQKTAGRKGRRQVATPWAPFVLLVVVALGGMVYGAVHGHGLIVALNAVVVLAIWGLRRLRAARTGAGQSPATGQPVGSPGGTHPGPPPMATSSPSASVPCPHTSAPHRTTTPAPEELPAPVVGELPVVGSFALTGRIHRSAKGTAAGLTVVLPADTDVTTTPVVAALLTTGHRILAEHHLTHSPLPEVEVTAVDRTAKPPTTTPATGFTVRVTNDLTTCSSHITVETNQPLATTDGTLLIAATVLAGAEHLLEGPDRPFHHRTTPTRRRRGRRRGHDHFSTSR